MGSTVLILVSKLIKIKGWRRDGSAKKHTNNICKDNHIHHISLYMLAFLDYYASIDVDPLVLSFESSWLYMHVGDIHIVPSIVPKEG